MPRHKEPVKQRSRSRSPYRDSDQRPRSPEQGSSRHRHRHRTHRSGDDDHRSANAAVSHLAVLPYGASVLTKDHFHLYEALFAQYLDVQKRLDLAALDPAEARGRWKSFIKKWNRHELAEGWYDPERLQKALAAPTASVQKYRQETVGTQRPPKRRPPSQDSSEDDGPGPYLAKPLMKTGSSKHQSGPSVPTMQDLELRKEQEADDFRQARSDLQWEQRANRTQEKERLEELAPKAMAGTKERQMEKKRERASANRSFADAKAGGDMAEVGDSELMGGDDEGIDAYKKKAKEMARQKNEREIRREEIMRAKQEERQQRAREIQEKEDRTMQGLLELAKQRFG